jgi:uncharacterized protein (DUF169 family)
MARYRDYSRRLTDCLGLRQSPVSIAFTDSLPAGIDAFHGRVAAGCRFWEEGTGKSFSTSVVDHNLCAIGVYTHNLEPSQRQQADLQDALKVMGDLGYVRPEDLSQIPVLSYRRNYVVYSPLAETALSPDVVLLFADPSQVLILLEAAQQVESGNAPAMGRPACAVVAQVINKGRAALSLGCCGARAYLDTLSDDVAIFAIPGANFEAYLERIEALANANAALAQFHQIRRRDVQEGRTPTVHESLAGMSS